jgi:hypothetical protein
MVQPVRFCSMSFSLPPRRLHRAAHVVVAVEHVAQVEHAELRRSTVAQIDEPVTIMSMEPTFTCCTTSLSLPSWLLGK